MTTFGTSASYIATCMKAEVEPARGRDLSALRAVGSTGSPLAPEGFAWVYEHVGEDTWLFSTSGGTDVCTAFVGGCPVLPVYEGELQARALGADLHAFDEDGQEVIDEVGELVITSPMPSMPLCFWGDEDGASSTRPTSTCTRASGATATGSGSRRAGPPSSTAARTRRSTAAGSAWGRARSTARCSRSTRSSTRSSSTSRRTGRRTGCRCSSCCATATSSTTTWSPRCASGSARTARRATSRARCARSPRCRGRCRARCSRSRSSGSSCGEEPERAASRESLANPQALDTFVALARERA